MIKKFFFLLPVFLIADLYEFSTIIVFKHRDQQSFVCFLIQKHAHTCVAALTPDSLIVKYLCIPDFKKIK